MKRSLRSEALRPKPAMSRGEGGRIDEDRTAYRKAPPQGAGHMDKKADVGAGATEVEFVSIIPTVSFINTTDNSLF